MKSKRTRKRPLSSVPQSTSASRKVIQSTISSFHTLLKRQAGYKRQLAGRRGEDIAHLEDALVKIDADILALGGLSAYQEASRLGQSIERGGDSSKILVEWLQELGMGHEGKRKLPAHVEQLTRLR